MNAVFATNAVVGIRAISAIDDIQRPVAGEHRGTADGFRLGLGRLADCCG
ncbi:MAG: hypothetical protein ACRDSL_20240 [Pseudonocardiaceae bacterium]